MKTLICMSLSVVLLILGCNTGSINSQTEIKNETQNGVAKIEFQEVLHDFGTIYKGETVTCKFKFKNTGTANLVLQKVEPSCGCTVPKYDTKPIPAGESGEIFISFDSSGFKGLQYKTIKVTTNGEPSILELAVTVLVQDLQN